MTTQSKNLLSFVLTIVLVPLLVGCASTNSRAMFDWEPATSVSYQFVQTQDQVLEIPGQGAQEQHTSTDIELTITAVAPRQFTVLFTDASSTGAQIEIDPLIGLTGLVTLDELGSPATVEGLDDNAFVTASGGAEIFKQNMIQALFLPIPEEDLKAGVSWTRESSVEFSQGGLNLERNGTDTYTVVQEKMLNGVSVFELTQTSDATIAGSGNQGGQDMTITLSGSLGGTLLVDAVGGHVLSTELSGEMKGFIEMQTMALPMTLTIGTNLKAVE